MINTTQSCPPGMWGAGAEDTCSNTCLCSVSGSRVQSCDRISGQCECVAGRSGHKCDLCSGGQVERSSGGCSDSDDSDSDVLLRDTDHDDSSGDQGPCATDPCQGGGSCEEHDGTFTCHCTGLRHGKHCEQELVTGHRTPGFHGQSQVTLAGVGPALSGVSSDIKIQFRTFTRSGTNNIESSLQAIINFHCAFASTENFLK